MVTSQWNLRQLVNHRSTDSIPLQCPPQTPGCHRTHSRGVGGYPLDVESFSPQLEGVEYLSEVAAIPGLVQAVQECAFQISNLDPDIANPDSTGAKEPLGTHLNESVCDSSNAAPPGGTDGLGASISGYKRLRRREDKYRPRYLFGQSVVAYGRPVRNRCWTH